MTQLESAALHTSSEARFLKSGEPTPVCAENTCRNGVALLGKLGNFLSAGFPLPSRKQIFFLSIRQQGAYPGFLSRTGEFQSSTNYEETRSIDSNLKRPAHIATGAPARSTVRVFLSCFIGLAALPRILHHLRQWQTRGPTPGSNLREDLSG